MHQHGEMMNTMEKGNINFKLKLDLEMMKEELGDEYVILLRTHHYIADALDVTGVEDFAYNLSKYDDITEIYLISDICITDYQVFSLIMLI